MQVHSLSFFHFELLYYLGTSLYVHFLITVSLMRPELIGPLRGLSWMTMKTNNCVIGGGERDQIGMGLILFHVKTYTVLTPNI